MPTAMRTLLLFHVIFGLLALGVVGVVAILHHARRASRVPRVAAAVVAVAEKVDPGEAPPLGVLTTPEKSRQWSRRFENVEWKLRRGARAVTTLSRSSG